MNRSHIPRRVKRTLVRTRRGEFILPHVNRDGIQAPFPNVNRGCNVTGARSGLEGHDGCRKIECFKAPGCSSVPRCLMAKHYIEEHNCGPEHNRLVRPTLVADFQVEHFVTNGPWRYQSRLMTAIVQGEDVPFFGFFALNGEHCYIYVKIDLENAQYRDFKCQIRFDLPGKEDCWMYSGETNDLEDKEDYLGIVMPAKCIREVKNRGTMHGKFLVEFGLIKRRELN